MSTIVAAQAATTLAHNNQRVGPECIAENKSLGAPMTNVIGISNLRVGASEFEEAMANNQAAETFKTKQTAFFSKTRMNPPQAVPIFRNFAYQRFEAEDPDH